MYFKLLVKIITLMTYAENKNIPFGYVDTDLESDTVQEARGLYFINVKLKLFDKLKQKLAEVASKCPIHKLMIHAENQTMTAVI